MNSLELTEENFHPTVAHTACLAIEVGMPRLDQQALDRLRQRHPTIVFAHLDGGEHPDIAALFGLKDAPALLIFRDQIVLYLKEGEHSAERIDELLRQLSALNMDDVRARIDEERRAELAVRMRRVCPTSRRGPTP